MKVKVVERLFEKIKEDRINYDKTNTNEEIVLNCHLFSSYRGTLVLKLPIGYNAFSFGFIGIGHKTKGTNLIKHEYGHRVQLKNMGLMRYIIDVAIPSVTANILDRMDKLPYDYYGSKWEHEADVLGEVEGRQFTPWPECAYTSYHDLIKLFFVSEKR